MRVLTVLLLAVFLSYISFSGAGAQSCTVDSDCGPSDMCVQNICLEGECLVTMTFCSVIAPCLESGGCDPETGCVILEKPDGTGCTPFGQTPCDGGGQCMSGQCETLPRDCDDMNECTADSCDSLQGCLNEAIEDGIACNEGAGVCSGGICTEPACDCASPDAITEGFRIHNKTLFVGTHRDDIICGTDGKDIIFGLAGNDCIDSGDGRDKVFSGPGDDTVFLGGGNDKGWGGLGNDEIDGQDDNDKVWGGPGEDMCFAEITRSCE